MKIHKTYCYDPGKTSPLPPIPSTEVSEQKTVEDSNVKSSEEEKPVENLNEFKENEETPKRSSLTISEKKMLPEALEDEENKNKKDADKPSTETEKLVLLSDNLGERLKFL